MTVQGLDVSKYQATTPSLTGAFFLIARRGIGTKLDLTYDMHIANARKAGLLTGSYWYGIGNIATMSVSDEVDAYIKSEGNVDLHVLDWEGSDGFTAAQARSFISLYKQRSGNRIWLYASEGRFADLGQDFDWIANYSHEPTRHYDMWQYGGFHGADGDLFNGTLNDLRVIAGQTGANDMAISTSGLTLTSDYAIDLPAGSDVLVSPGGAKVGDFGGTFDYFGSSGGFKAIRVPGPTGSEIAYTASAATPYKKVVVPAPVTVDGTPYSEADVQAKLAAQEANCNEALASTVAFKAALKAFLAD